MLFHFCSLLLMKQIYVWVYSNDVRDLISFIVTFALKRLGCVID